MAWKKTNDIHYQNIADSIRYAKDGTEYRTTLERVREEIMQDNEYFDDISEAVQSKTGHTESYTKDDLANVINEEWVQPTLIEKTFTANGTYSAEDDNADGYSEVTVALPFEERTVTPANEPRVVTPQAGYAAMSKVTVEKIPDFDLNKSLFLIDWDGTLLKSYTTDEALALDSLPATPGVEHELLLFQEWNWSLADIKEYLHDKPCGHLVVGATYTTTDGQDHNFYQNTRINDNTRVYMSKRASLDFGGYKFRNWYQLEKVNIPRGVTSLELGLFSGCDDLSAVVIPSGVTSVHSAFSAGAKTGITSVPKSLTVYNGANATAITGIIGYCWNNKIMFHSNTLIKAIDISDNVTALPDYFCYKTTSLNNIDIPSSVETIGAYAFYSSSIIDIILRGKPDLLASITNPNLRVYVPRANLSWFETATNWSTLYAAGKIVAIEDYIDYLESIHMDVSGFRTGG